jgi:hypothetical protein
MRNDGNSVVTHRRYLKTCAARAFRDRDAAKNPKLLSGLHHVGPETFRGPVWIGPSPALRACSPRRGKILRICHPENTDRPRLGPSRATTRSSVSSGPPSRTICATWTSARPAPSVRRGRSNGADARASVLQAAALAGASGSHGPYSTRASTALTASTPPCRATSCAAEPGGPSRPRRPAAGGLGPATAGPVGPDAGGRPGLSWGLFARALSRNALAAQVFK